MAYLKYQIQFFSYWHCGTGLAKGADVDELVIKDKRGLPFIPGKTIKGLVREAVEDYFSFKGEEIPMAFITAFGNSKDKNNKKNVGDADYLEKGEMFFSNAEFEKDVAETLVNTNSQNFLVKEIASTAIDNDGVAKKNSLRKMEVVVPCILEGEIISIPNEMVSCLEYGLKMIKRLGQNRHRGLGRCQFSLKVLLEGGSI